MVSISHWGMFWLPQKQHSPAWYNEIRDQKYYDAEYIHGVFQRLNFGDLD